MRGKVLVPTDFSRHAKKIIVCVTKIPGIKEVVLQHVVDATRNTKHGWTHEPHIKNAKIQLEEEKELLEGLGFEVRVIVDVITSGDVPAAILARAESEKVSYIVIGSRGRGLVQGLLLGSVSADVLRRGKTHLLIIRQSLAGRFEETVIDRFCSGIFSRVLFPTDFSGPAKKALSVIKDFEGLGEVHVLHVVTRGETREEIDANVREATKKLEAIKSELAGAGLSVKVHIRLGRPTDEIITLADREDISLILMSSHGKGLLTELLVGSTTLGVAIHTDKPLMIIRT
ncbi:MAG: universal stress protein [Methanoregulaceae archaeon]|nr:universal stress protein [Methanoregulaceae archaeon]